MSKVDFVNLPMSTSRVDKASHSETESYLMCQRRHYYAYIQRLQSQRSSDPLARGVIGHAVLSFYYQGRKDGKSHDDAAMDAMEFYETYKENFEVFNPDKLFVELEFLLLNYFTKYEDDRFTVLETEVRHDVQITEDYVMPIVVDLILDIPGRGVVIRDWKFTQDFYTIDKTDMSPQLPKYFAAALELGYKPSECEYDQIRYRETREYKENPFARYMRTPVVLTPEKVTRMMEEQMRVANRIGALRTHPLEDIEKFAVRNAMACYICPFTDLCNAELNDSGDAELIAQSFFERRV